MSNTKNVYIEGEVPFDWLTSYDGPLTDEDVATIGGTFAAPSGGLELRYRESGYVPNDHGGQTAMYSYTITGQEAVSCIFLARLVHLIEKAGGTVEAAELTDLDDPGPAEPIQARWYLEWKERQQ